MKLINLKKHEMLFLLVVLLMPANLGKHFISVDSYVGGILVDYLIPTLYLTDILVFVTLLFWLFDNGLNEIRVMFLKSQKIVHLLTLLVVAGIFSTFVSIQPSTSVIVLLRWVGYLLLLLYAYNFKKMQMFYRVVSCSTFFLSLLCILQFVGQGSFFDNYLFFGEQPYAASTKGIVLENLNGVAKVPSYGTFRHPNVLGGYISVVIIWLYAQFKLAKKTEKNALLMVFVLGFVALILSFSQSALIAFMLGFGLHVIADFWPKKIKKLGLAFTLCVLLLGLFLPLWASRIGLVGSSIERRSNLLVSGVKIASENLVYGTGLGTNTAVIEQYIPMSRDLRFIQPVHNIFILILSEGGLIFAFLLFLIIAYSLYFSYHHGFIFFVSLLQLLFLGSFDHYILTHLQTFLLFMLTLAFSLTYNQLDYV